MVTMDSQWQSPENHMRHQLSQEGQLDETVPMPQSPMRKWEHASHYEMSFHKLTQSYLCTVTGAGIGVQVLRPTRHKIGSFRRRSPSQSQRTGGGGVN